MKKRIALLLAALLAVGSLTACGGNGNAANNGGDAAATVKLGLGACTSFSSSYSIGEEHYGAPAEATNAQVDIHVAAVTLDAEGKIVSCDIDAIQVKATVDATGAIAADAATEFTSKNDLKEGYNMKGASPIGKEWYEQADAFEKYIIGMTSAQVEALLGSDGYPTDETLQTGCTMKIAAYIAAINNALSR